MEDENILRLVYKKIEPLGLEKVRMRGISTVESFNIDTYKVVFDSLILQHPSSTDPLRYKGPFRILQVPWISYCKWHSGSLDSRDRPWERIYCNLRAEGYCRQHRKSDRYLYDMCMSLKGERALEACKILDRRIKTEYAVYMLDSGGKKPKVGSTRAFRLFERIAEQSHLVATLLAIYESAREARSAEMKISTLGFAMEHQRRGRARLSRAQAASRLSGIAEKVSHILGQEWDGKLFMIRPSYEVPPILKYDKLVGQKLYPVDYWGGLIIIKSLRGKFSIEERPLLHKLSFKIILEEGDT